MKIIVIDIFNLLFKGILYPTTHLAPKTHCLKEIHQFQLDSSEWGKNLTNLAWGEVLKESY